MIIWINGAFGSGKTTIAKLLHEQLKPSYIYDPENIGTLLQHNIPLSLQLDDFQDYSEWREWNVQLLSKIEEEYKGTLIVPMTLCKPSYYDDIISTLRNQGIVVKHFQLEVSRKELINRLEKRSESNLAWGLAKMDECLTMFQDIPQKEKIMNEEKTPEEVVSEIITILK